MYEIQLREAKATLSAVIDQMPHSRLLPCPHQYLRLAEKRRSLTGAGVLITHPLAGGGSVASALPAVVLILGEHVDALPAPVDTMCMDEPVLDLHHLDKVHLLTVGAA